MIEESVEAFGPCQTEVIASSPRLNPRDLFVVDPLRDPRWPALIEKHRASSVFHSTAWLSALSITYGYEPVVFTTCRPSAELTSGIVFCKVKSWLTGRRLVSLPFSDHCDPLVGSPEALDDLLESVGALVDRGLWDYCEVRPVRFEPGVGTKQGLSNRHLWHVTDLRPPIEGIVRNLHHSARRSIQRAERESLVYEEGNSERLLGKFYKLLVMTRRRQNLPPQPITWFRNLIKTFGENLKIRVTFSGDTPVASILTLNHKGTVTYKYGCSDARMHRLGGVALLFWHTIVQAKAAGYEHLDLGRTEIGNKGLTDFKEHWGGVCSSLSYWRYPNARPFHEKVQSRGVVGRIVEACPDRVLVLAGDIFYRHIG
jgi:hypothetical protein